MGETTRFRIIKYHDKVVVERHELIKVEIPIKDPPEWLAKQGFDAFMASWHGFGFARKNGKWYFVDDYQKEILDEADDPRDNLQYLLGHVVSPDEWGSWVFDIPAVIEDATQVRTFPERSEVVEDA